MSRFDRHVVVDDQGKPLAGAVGYVYHIDDTSRTTPLSILSLTGVPLPLNQLVANNDGVTPQFTTAARYRGVTWVSGIYENDMIPSDLVPDAGTTGQALVKLSGANQDVGWADASGVPSGGTAGQILTKKSSTPGDAGWADNIVNVKALGAKGDGTTDDYAILQSALDAGGAIYFPPGDYRVSQSLKVQLDGMTLLGAGPGNRNGGTQPGIATRIRASGSLIGPVILVQRAADDRPLTAITIQNLAVDGNAQGAEGIIFRASQSSLQNVSIWACTTGLRIRGYAVPYWDTYDTRIHNCLVGQCTTAGVFLDNNTSDLHFDHSVFLANYDNFIISGGASHQITGCHFYDPTRYNVWFNGSGSRTKFANCKIEAAGQHGMLIDSTNGGYADIQITGCGFSSVDDAATDNAWDLLHITGPTANGITRLTIVGNNFNNKSGNPKKPRFGVNISGSVAQGTVVVGNSFGPASNWGTAPLNNGSNSTNQSFVRANAGQPSLYLPIVKTAAFTAAPSDCDQPIEVNSATPVTITIPANAQPGFQKGNKLEVTQTGTGQVTFAGAAGVNLRTPKSLTTRAQYSTVTLRLNGTNNWILDGDLT